MEVITLFGAFLQSSRPQAGRPRPKAPEPFCQYPQTLPRAQRHRGNFFSIDEQRDIFSRMVGARRCGIAAVIGGDHKHIIRPQMRQKTSQPAVKGGNGGGVAATSLRWPYNISKSTRLTKQRPRKSSFSSRLVCAMPSAFPLVGIARETPRPAKISLIFPTATVPRPCSRSRSSIVTPGAPGKIVPVCRAREVRIHAGKRSGDHAAHRMFAREHCARLRQIS